MGVIWRNTLKALNQSDAEKVLAYAREHYKERGLEDYDEQTMGGLEFNEDCLTYTEVHEDRLKVFYEFADEIGAAFPEMELHFSQVGDDHIFVEFIYKNGVCTRYEPRVLELIAADRAEGERLVETAVPIIEAAGFSVNVQSEYNSVSFECDAKSCEEFKDILAEQIAGLMPDSKLLCVLHDLDEQEFPITEYCILDGHKGAWESTDMAMYYLALTFSEDGTEFSIYDVILNPVSCFKKLQKELRSGEYYNAYTAQYMLMAETPYHDRLMDLLTPEDAAWITEDERINGDIEQVRYSFDIKLSDDAIQRVLNDIYAKCEMA